MPTGAERIAAERDRQILSEGFDAVHDDQYSDQLLRAARCYLDAAGAVVVGLRPMRRPPTWPFGWRWWRASEDDPIRNLEKAGALIAAEIDRLQRAAKYAAVGRPVLPTYTNPITKEPQ